MYGLTGWIAVPTNEENFIHDPRLKNTRQLIYVTFQAKSGKRLTRRVECCNGKIDKKLDGFVVAWMPQPKPYMGPALLAGRMQCQSCRKYLEYQSCPGCILDNGVVCEGYEPSYK